jgi:hypothetical protein
VVVAVRAWPCHEVFQAQCLVSGFDGGECCKFVAAQTSRDAVASGPCGEADADRGEGGVAGGMTKVVVKLLFKPCLVVC